MSHISDAEMQQATAAVINLLKKKDIRGMLKAQREDYLDEFIHPHLQDYIAKKYPPPVSSPAPTKEVIKDTQTVKPVVKQETEIKAPAKRLQPPSLASYDQEKMVNKPPPAPIASKVRESEVIKVRDSEIAPPSPSMLSMSVFSGGALETGANVWARSEDGEWVRAVVLSMEKLPPTKQTQGVVRFQLELQSSSGMLLGENLQVDGVPAGLSREEFESVKLRNSTDDDNPDSPNDTEEDLIRLCYLHEASILASLRRRFERNLIYTSTGPILIAVV